MTSACFINFMTHDVFPEPKGHPTIHVNGCFHFGTSSHGSEGKPLLQFVFVHFVIVYDAIFRL